MMNRSNEKSAQISMFWAEGGLNSWEGSRVLSKSKRLWRHLKMYVL
jgi:hypothetical protein